MTPAALWPACRSDLPLKARMVQAMIDGCDLPLAKEMYRWHTLHKVRSWVSDWGGLEAFFASTGELLASIRTHGFRPDGPIMLGRERGLMNGAHRFAICGALGIPPVLKRSAKPGVVWDFSWFGERGMPLEHQQRLLFDWVRFDPTTAVFLFWGPARLQWDAMLDTLRPDFELVGYLDLAMPNTRALVHDVYGLSPDLPKMMRNVRKKRDLLSDHPGEVRVVVAKRVGKVDATAVKEGVRAASGVKRDLFVSCHASSTRREALYLADLVLSPVNIRHLWMRPPEVRPEMVELIIAAKEALRREGVDYRDACVVGGAVLDVLGLRPSSGDIDLTVTERGRSVLGQKARQLAPNVDLVSRTYHRGAVNPYSDDGLIQSAEAHFNVLGAKFATARVVMDTKTLHARAKDVRDVEMLRREFAC